jgi:hypothetical protein
MFNKKQIVRNFIFGFFCALILLVSLSLTYYISFYENEEMGPKIQNENDKEPICETIRGRYFINSIYFKLMAAFFAGGVLAEGIWFRVGVF